MATQDRGYATEIKAPVELVWSVMLDKIKHPERYLPGPYDIQILDEGAAEGGTWVIREMSVPAVPYRLREKITYKAGEMLVEFLLLDHPKLEGAIYNKVHVDGEKVSLEYYTTHKLKDEAAADNPPLLTNFQAAVLHSKEVIEKLYSEGKTSV